MSYVIIEDTNSQLAQLVDQVSRGEEIIVVRDHAVVTKIIPMPLRYERRAAMQQRC